MIEQPQSINSNQGYFGLRSGEGKQYVSNYSITSGNMGEKRAPKGFMGMRGKKRDEELNDDDFESKFYPINQILSGVRGEKNLPLLQ